MFHRAWSSVLAMSLAACVVQPEDDRVRNRADALDDEVTCDALMEAERLAQQVYLECLDDVNDNHAENCADLQGDECKSCMRDQCCAEKLDMDNAAAAVDEVCGKDALHLQFVEPAFICPLKPKQLKLIELKFAEPTASWYEHAQNRGTPARRRL